MERNRNERYVLLNEFIQYKRHALVVPAGTWSKGAKFYFTSDSDFMNGVIVTIQYHDRYQIPSGATDIDLPPSYYYRGTSYDMWGNIVSAGSNAWWLTMVNEAQNQELERYPVTLLRRIYIPTGTLPADPQNYQIRGYQQMYFCLPFINLASSYCEFTGSITLANDTLLVFDFGYIPQKHIEAVMDLIEFAGFELET